MYRLAPLVALIVTVSTDQQTEKCLDLFQPDRDLVQCCAHKLMDLDDSKDSPEFKECVDLPPISCARDECFGKKFGFFVDGSINMQLLTKTMEDEFDKQIMTLVKDKCVGTNADLSKYGTSDMCDLKKIHHCTQIQTFKTCSSWKDNGVCNGVQQLVEGCAAMGL